MRGMRDLFFFVPLWRRFRVFMRGHCLPVLSLTRTPSGGHCEWMAACCDPFFEYCERSVWIVGLVCFLLVLVGISTVVYTFYRYMVSFLYLTEPSLLFGFYFIYGHFLLINISFHYVKGVYTKPIPVPSSISMDLSQEQVKNGWKICYKCNLPKPPRAHHCRVCGRCILKMDHHCRTCYVVHCCWTRVIHAMNLDKGYLASFINTFGFRGSMDRAGALPLDSVTWEGFLVIIVFFICFGVTVALLMLGGWNCYLVSRGETAIEFYLNQRDARECKRRGKTFVRPYNHGAVNNWKLFLGLDHGRSFIRHVLIPSGHKPLEDGMTWRRVDTTTANGPYRTPNVV